jgi:hypothetical protein
MPIMISLKRHQSTVVLIALLSLTILAPIVSGEVKANPMVTSQETSNKYKERANVDPHSVIAYVPQNFRPLVACRAPLSGTSRSLSRHW